MKQTNMSQSYVVGTSISRTSLFICFLFSVSHLLGIQLVFVCSIQTIQLWSENEQDVCSEQIFIFFFNDKDMLASGLTAKKSTGSILKTHKYVTSVVFWEDFNLYSDFQITTTTVKKKLKLMKRIYKCSRFLGSVRPIKMSSFFFFFFISPSA